MRKLSLTLLALSLAACGRSAVSPPAREDYGPPPARRSLEAVRITSEDSHVVAREKTPPAAGVARASARFHLGGVDCGSCAPILAVELGQLAGVREARVSQTTPEAVVEFDPERLTPRQVLGAIARTGLHPKELPPSPGKPVLP